MSESSSSPGGGEEPFDAEAFARQTVNSIEVGDAYASVLERRVIRIEEIIAARWPRSWVLRRRLAREIRASVVTWDEDYIERGNFYGRRLEAAEQETSDLLDRQSRARRDRQADETGPQDDGADPGEGFLS